MYLPMPYTAIPVQLLRVGLSSRFRNSEYKGRAIWCLQIGRVKHSLHTVEKVFVGSMSKDYLHCQHKKQKDLFTHTAEPAVKNSIRQSQCMHNTKKSNNYVSNNIVIETPCRLSKIPTGCLILKFYCSNCQYANILPSHLSTSSTLIFFLRA